MKISLDPNSFVAKRSIKNLKSIAKIKTSLTGCGFDLIENLFIIIYLVIYNAQS